MRLKGASESIKVGREYHVNEMAVKGGRVQSVQYDTGAKTMLPESHGEWAARCYPKVWKRMN